MIEIVNKPWIWRDAFTVDEREMIAVVLPKYSLEQIGRVKMMS
jgi:hypothetical protein